MSRGVNKVILVGTLGEDPKVIGAVTKLSLATNEEWTDKATGQKQKRTEWHRVTLFAKLGEIAAEYLRKGKEVYIEGQLRTDKYTDKDGIERYSTEVIARDMQLLGGKSEGSGSAPRAQSAPAARANTAQPPAAAASDFEDDIPF